MSEIGTFIMENAKDLMYLAFGLGVLILAFSMARTLGTLRRTVEKVEDLIDMVDSGLRKPAEILMELTSYVAPVMKFLGKRK